MRLHSFTTGHFGSSRKTCHTTVNGSHETWRASQHCFLAFQQSAPELNINKEGVSLSSQNHLSPMTSKFPANIHGMHLERGGELDWWFIDSWYGRSKNDATIWNSRKKVENLKRWTFKNKERDNEDLFPCRTGEMLQEWQPLSTAVYRGTEGEARDPSPDLEARQDFWSMMGNHICPNHVAPRTKTPCSSGRFTDTSESYWCSEGNQNEPWATIDVFRNMCGDEKSWCEAWIGVTRFALLNKNPPEGYMCVQGRLTQKHVTTRMVGNMWPREQSAMSKGTQRKAINKWTEEKPQLDAAKEQRGSYFTPDDDPDHEEIVNSARQTIGSKEGLSDSLQSRHTSRPEQFNLGAKRKDWTLHVQRKIRITSSSNREGLESLHYRKES